MQSIRQLIDPQLTRGKIELEQAHAAADIRTDPLRMNLIRQNGAADRSVLAGMQIRHGRDGPDTGKSRYLFKLHPGIALDPGFG